MKKIKNLTVVYYYYLNINRKEKRFFFFTIHLGIAADGGHLVVLFLSKDLTDTPRL